ncbi:MAG: M3 family metallopeptidase [Bacteroidales bacterium]|nr:M3 family metallopeptidase [Bacteroidales bacterium]
MKKILTGAVALCLALPPLAAQNTSSDVTQNNPFLQEYTTPYQIPPFSLIKNEHYLPALKEGISRHNAEIAAIAGNPEAPTFANTVLALDRAGALVERVVMVYAALSESNSSPELQAVAEEFEPLLAAHSDEVSMNPALFARVKKLYDSRDKLGLDSDQKLMLEHLYKDFVRSGALLDEKGQAELKALNGELADLYLKFNKNLLAATNDFQIVVDDKAELAGLPQSNIDVAADEARARGLEGKYVLTLHAPSRLPVLQYADNRDLRRRMYQGYTTLASSGQYDNRPVISKILQARSKKARLLGFKDYGSFMTDNVMAGSVKAAEDLLMQIWGPAVKRANEEVREMQALADKEKAGIKIAPWDYAYYNEKVRRNKYNLDEAKVRAYFAVDSVRNGIFTMAEKLYNIKFTEKTDWPKYYDEVKVYDVTDATNGEHIAVFMTDYFPRASKRQGAWMSEFKGSWVNDDGTADRPVIYNVGNFSKPTGDTPSLLTIDEVETMFHEFGHGLHGMLSRARYKGQAGTNVDRDFVELPSQIHEHWAFHPDMLKLYARHWQTGEVIPADMVKKLQEASTHNMGFRTTELVGAALLDLQYGKLNPEGETDVEAFENAVSKQLGMPAEITYRYRSPYFKHIFGSDGYASGYYTYLWAEVLDCDGFEKFAENGIFDPATAKSFRENILEKGGSVEPMELYLRFRGHKPEVKALLKKRGLDAAN